MMIQEQVFNRTVRQSKIVGGSVAGSHEFPYQVSLTYMGEFLCGGSILNTLFILTAAHCVKHKTVTRLKINAGRNDLYSTDGLEQTRMARDVYIHDDYNHVNLHNDIAVILLDSPLKYSQAVKNINLPRKSENFDGYVVVSGWGAVHEGGPITRQLRKVILPIVTNEICKRSYEKVRLSVTEKMMCAGKASKDACQGDSGSPAVCNRKLFPSLRKTSLVVCGIVSFGHGCGRMSFPGVFTMVSKYIDWIENIQEFSKAVYPSLAHEKGKCRTDRFHCASRCLPRSFVCDEISDCPSNEDEARCTHYSKCTKLQFRCDNGRCVRRDQVCNEIDDCSDGSDENKCSTTNKTCVEDQFRCEADNRCIPAAWRCDKQKDCDDISDERNCDGCTSDEFFCVAESKCINISSVCDGSIDCIDFSDESGCSNHKSIGIAISSPELYNNEYCANRFKCDNGRCILQQSVCDFDDDCWDGSDERNCTRRECTPSEWKCLSGQCIHYRKQCNGNINCYDESDEMDCN